MLAPFATKMGKGRLWLKATERRSSIRYAQDLVENTTAINQQLVEFNNQVWSGREKNGVLPKPLSPQCHAVN